MTIKTFLAISLGCCVWLLSGAFALAQAPTLEKTPVKPENAAGWRDLTLRDLDSIENIVRVHTPIPLDTENIATREWLDTGIVAARVRAATVENEVGWYYTLAAFVNGFRDPHVSIRPTATLPDPNWPGFIVAAKGANGVVVFSDASDADALAVGTEILQCDEKPLAALIDERVFPFVLNAALPADRRRAIPRLFIDRQIPFAPAPKTCLVRSGAKFTDKTDTRAAATDVTGRVVTLRWRLAPKERDALAMWNRELNNAGFGATPAFGVSEPAPGVTWISVPTFNSGGESGKQLNTLVNDVAKRGDAMRNGAAIVIDTRGNSGGNSAWADKLAAAIFTPTIISKHRVNTGAQGTDWRVSMGNIEHWKSFDQVISKDFGTFSKERLFPQYVASSMQTALDNGESLWRQGNRKNGASGGLTQKRLGFATQASPFKARVYFLSNGSCGSSCLNFADTVLFIPGVMLIGSATAGDGMLMDVRSVETASGLAQLTIPQKVARDRARGNLEYYAPDIAYEGAWNDAAVRAWVIGLINNKIAKSN